MLSIPIVHVNCSSADEGALCAYILDNISSDIETYQYLKANEMQIELNACMTKIDDTDGLLYVVYFTCV